MAATNFYSLLLMGQVELVMVVGFPIDDFPDPIPGRSYVAFLFDQGVQFYWRGFMLKFCLIT
ncbi:hypothetical protein LYNGBM3L_33370 [Moorena producens 3L]|uniref:Uncharacterized protein n=1 Tax=Moorena producens 3L TaxID=489825 RepID=F4XUD0_9CYAN|nr:hypothetical protein LYNGBM3L_33370 [Moorena producens 3L]OLT63778.1 hypothetical protein BI334_00950 [Moorena producens 3L]